MTPKPIDQRSLSWHTTSRVFFLFLGGLAFLALQCGEAAAAGRIANVSTRANVGTGNNNVVLGTILVGSGSATLVFRGIGPSMAPYLPPGTTLANPYLQILNSSGGTLGTNNNWQDDPGQAAAIQAAGLAPTNANESAFRIVLGPGTYSAVLTGVGGGTGIGLVEVYDITSQPSSIKLGNVSTRANAGTGNNAEIFGVITQGGNRSLVLRGIGPSLAPYFPPGSTLANPALSLMSGGTQLQYNQNWKDYPYYPVLISGFAPSNDLESAMVTGNLNGAYTVIMDTAGASGLSTIEAYDLGELIWFGGPNTSLVCNQFPNSTIAQSGSFTVPASTPLTLRFAGHASFLGSGCPQCNQPGGPGCGGSWGMNALLIAGTDNVAAGFTNTIGGSGQCHVLFSTGTASGIFNFAPPYRLRIRGSSSVSCQVGSGLTVDYYLLHAP